MLLTLISIVTLITFMLLLLSGFTIEIALYRSILLFMLLFAVLYFSIFMANLIKQNRGSDSFRV